MGQWASSRSNRGSTGSSSTARSRSMFASRPFGHEKPVVERSLFSSRPFSPPDVTAGKPTQPNALPGYSYNFALMPLNAPEAAAPVQAKLTVGQPNDPYEQEADQMAEQVMSTSAPTAQPSVQREAMEDVQTKPSLQRNADGGLQADSDLESRLYGSKGGGSPLPDEVRSQMEPQFGSDFSQVRVHTDNPAVQMNQDLNAEAFTHKQDIYFGSGRYNPGSNSGKQLLAHELTHVVQQTGGVQTKPNQEPTVQRECAACEEEGAVQRKSNEISASSEIGIQRWFGDDEEKKEPESSSGGGILDWAKGKVSGAVNSVAETGGAAVDWAKQKGSAAAETVTHAGGEAVDWAKEKASGAVNSVVETSGEAVDWAKQKGNAVVESVTQPEDEAIDGAEQKGGQPDTKAYIAPTDWLDYIGIAVDLVERVYINVAYEEGEEKTAQLFVNSLFLAIDVVLAALPGAGGGGLAARASRELAVEGWRTMPASAKLEVIDRVAKQMGWTVNKAAQMVNAFFRTAQSGEGERRDIESHEDAGGHTEERHVGESENSLQKRLDKEPDLQFASSFRNTEIANRTQGKFVKQFREQIEAWLKGGEARFVEEIDMSEPIGIVVERGRRGAFETAIEATRARLVLIRDNSVQGWHFLTSFPIK